MLNCQLRKSVLYIYGVVIWHYTLYKIRITGKVCHKVEMDIEQAIHQLKFSKDFPVTYLFYNIFTHVLIDTTELAVVLKNQTIKRI